MTEEPKQAVKEEEDDFDGPISALNRKSLKKREPISKDGLDDDDVPLAFSKVKKKKPSNPPRVKKEEPVDDEDEKPLKKMDGLKKRPSHFPKVEKYEPEDDEEEKPLKKKEDLKKSVKKEVHLDFEDEEEDKKKSKKRKRSEEKRTQVKVKKVEASQEKVKNDKKEKKVFELPGQKHDPPEIRDPLRIFYETLYDKVPTSEMASIWLMERGLLSLEEAQKVYAKKLKKNHNQKFSSPAKVTTPVKKSSTVLVEKKVKVTSKASVKTTKKKVIDSEDDDEDFVLNKLGNKTKVSS
ncbi:hypothetical protein KFK09_019038 [Dendrobium nobile]|uniref:Uncharacterized protein n=1 Tax=Dendrobium nobile TaxID=94219 RepID=A0A8T3AXJ3_DENNO|nr:hypothetical protein KFK09_019038 [Dendrobium nobile]